MSSDIDIENTVRRLTPLEQAVLKARFGVPADDGRSIPKGQLPRSPGQLRRIERRALRKLRAESAARGPAEATPACPPAAIDLKSTELLNMAAFKLHDCAQRILQLAHAGPSPALGAKFLSIHRQLLQQQEHLRTALRTTALVPNPPKASAASPSTC